MPGSAAETVGTFQLTACGVTTSRIFLTVEHRPTTLDPQDGVLPRSFQHASGLSSALLALLDLPDQRGLERRGH